MNNSVSLIFCHGKEFEGRRGILGPEQGLRLAFRQFECSPARQPRLKVQNFATSVVVQTWVLGGASLGTRSDPSEDNTERNQSFVCRSQTQRSSTGNLWEYCESFPTWPKGEAAKVVDGKFSHVSSKPTKLQHNKDHQVCTKLNEICAWCANSTSVVGYTALCSETDMTPHPCTEGVGWNKSGWQRSGSGIAG